MATFSVVENPGECMHDSRPLLWLYIRRDEDAEFLTTGSQSNTLQLRKREWRSVRTESQSPWRGRNPIRWSLHSSPMPTPPHYRRRWRQQTRVECRRTLADRWGTACPWQNPTEPAGLRSPTTLLR